MVGRNSAPAGGRPPQRLERRQMRWIEKPLRSLRSQAAAPHQLQNVPTHSHPPCPPTTHNQPCHTSNSCRVLLKPPRQTSCDTPRELHGGGGWEGGVGRYVGRASRLLPGVPHPPASAVQPVSSVQRSGRMMPCSGGAAGSCAEAAACPACKGRASAPLQVLQKGRPQVEQLCRVLQVGGWRSETESTNP